MEFLFGGHQSRWFIGFVTPTVNGSYLVAHPPGSVSAPQASLPPACHGEIEVFAIPPRDGPPRYLVQLIDAEPPMEEATEEPQTGPRSGSDPTTQQPREG